MTERQPGARPVVVATSNRGKVAEIQSLLAGLPIALRPLDPERPLDFAEEGDDYEANSAEKARFAAGALGELAVADDSGLEVDALGGAPGARSARYGGEGLDDAGRVRHLLASLERASSVGRRARFVCWASLATPRGEVISVRGECAGEILREPRGEGGFGYDPVFRPDGYAGSMAELSSEEKNRISHRARAFRALRQHIEQLAG